MAWFAPVVVEGDDVGVFEAGDHLRFYFKAADEFRVIGKCRQDYLDSHIAPHARLKSAIDLAKPSRANPLPDLVSTNRKACQVSHKTRQQFINKSPVSHYTISSFFSPVRWHLSFLPTPTNRDMSKMIAASRFFLTKRAPRSRLNDPSHSPPKANPEK